MFFVLGFAKATGNIRVYANTPPVKYGRSIGLFILLLALVLLVLACLFGFLLGLSIYVVLCVYVVLRVLILIHQNSPPKRFYAYSLSP